MWSMKGEILSIAEQNWQSRCPGSDSAYRFNFPKIPKNQIPVHSLAQTDFGAGL
jgi:hypothetical protein